MKLFHFLGFTKELVFGSSTPVTRLNLFLYVFFVCFIAHFIRVRNDKCSSFNVQLFSSYKLLFRITEFAHLLRMFSRFYPHF